MRVLFFILMSIYCLAQTLPIDERIKIGHLKNGFTYYLMHNEEPEDRLTLFLAVDAGSVLEEDDQQGLAHFVEHMAFNGTKHFEKNEVVEVLQKAGAGFGPHINAFTSFDRTVYMLHIPSNDEEAVKNAFRILSDWACCVTFEPEEIDKERGVVLEEWRLSQNAFMEVLRQTMPILYKGSRYAERIPIGKKEIIQNAPRERIVQFYKDWYRPDLMAIIVVGDLPVETMEKWIKKYFTKIRAPKHPKQRKYYGIEDFSEVRVAIATHKELPTTQVSISFLQDKDTILTETDYKRVLLRKLIATIMKERYDEIIKTSEEPPFISAGVHYGSAIRTRDEWEFNASTKPDKIAEAFQILWREAVRAYQHGFTIAELRRAKKKLLEQYRKAAQEKDKVHSRQWAFRIVWYHQDKSPLLPPEYAYKLAEKQLKQITPEQLHAYYRSLWRKDNRMIMIAAVEDESLKLPTKEQLKHWLDSLEQQTWEPPKEEEVITTFMDSPPAPETRYEIVKTIKEIGVTEAKLSNGITLFLKPTDFKEDEIILYAISPGGRSLLPQEKDVEAVYCGEVLKEAVGVQDLPPLQLQKALAGKQLKIQFDVSEYQESIFGKSTLKDFETLLQLLYLYLHEPLPDKKAFVSYVERSKAQYKMMMNFPQLRFFYEMTQKLYGEHPRNYGVPHPSHFEQLDLNETIQVFKERFKNFQDFAFFVVGNFQIDTLLPLLAKYLGGLPTEQSPKEAPKDMGLYPQEGSFEIRAGQYPQSMVAQIFHLKKELPYEEVVAMYVAAKILEMRLIKQIREKASKVYSINAIFDYDEEMTPVGMILVFYPCGPENVDTLKGAIKGIIKELAQTPPSDDEIAKAVKQLKVQREEALQKNDFWAQKLARDWVLEKPLTHILDFIPVLERMDAAVVYQVYKKWLNQARYFEMVLFPEKNQE